MARRKMNLRGYALRLAVLALPLCVGASRSISAVSEPALDDQADSGQVSSQLPSNWSEPASNVVQITIPPPPAAPPPSERTLSANPLWAMPLKQFSATRERPIFLPSRRPPAPAVTTAVVPKTIVVPKPKEPERPQVSLVGTISGDDEKFGIFIDLSTKAVIRLKLGEEFQGWKLQSVQGREAALEKDQQVVTLMMPQAGIGQVSIDIPQSPVAVHRTRSTTPETRPGR
jgi:hypothetical protein